GGNQTQTQFVLLGITDNPCLQVLLFELFLLIYIVCLVGNVGLMLLVWTVPSLHTPMYFFLAHFSFMDACYSTLISPRMLRDLLAEDRTISFAGCVAQFHGFAFFVTSECHLLASMAFDRHVAICKPLLYVRIISSRVCWQLVAWCYFIASLSALVFTACTFGGSFCGHNHIDHFFCDTTPVLRLVCSDTRLSQVLIFIFVSFNGLSTVGMILLSYSRILHAVLATSSAQSRSRAFNTCTSHLTVVSLFYGTLFYMYLQPASRHGSQDKVASILYTVVTPTLNPFIYSLRNKEVKGALLK
ncbi:Olfactory receptor 1020, partial [Chaetura pelagica]